MDEVIKIYTDGGCTDNGSANSIGGWGAVLIYKGKVKHAQGAIKGITNNQAEIIAVIEPLKMIKDKTIPIEIYSDSQYVVSMINEKWRKKKNHELWAELEILIQTFSNIKFIKVTAHSGNHYNEIADELATSAITKLKQMGWEE